MTFSEAQRQHIVKIRLTNAEQMLADASSMLASGSLRSAANRCYYANPVNVEGMLAGIDS